MTTKVAFEVDVGTVEVLDDDALEVDDALAAADVFPFDVLDALALEEDELLAVDVVVLSGVADVGADELESVGVVSCDDCIEIRDTVLEEKAEAELVELCVVLVELDWTELVELA